MLPTALLDLTLLRLSALRATNAANTVLRRVSARGMQQAALATPSPPYNCPPSMLTPSQTMWDVSAELERRVNALQNAAAVEVCPSVILTLIIIYFHSSRKQTWIRPVTPNKI